MRLERFESFYLASPRRRDKAAFAKRLQSAVDASSLRSAGGTGPPQAGPTRGGWPGWVSWRLAAAAAVLLAAGLALLDDAHVRRDLRGARQQAADAAQRSAEVSSLLDEQQKAAAAARQSLAAAREAQARPPSAGIAVVLMPLTRGVGDVPTIALGPGTTSLPLALKVEGARRSTYAVTLRDPSTNRVVWRSQTVTVRRTARPEVVAISVPADLLNFQHYTLELYALHGGARDLVGSYAFEVVEQ